MIAVKQVKSETFTNCHKCRSLSRYMKLVKTISWLKLISMLEYFHQDIQQCVVCLGRMNYQDTFSVFWLSVCHFFRLIYLQATHGSFKHSCKFKVNLNHLDVMSCVYCFWKSFVNYSILVSCYTIYYSNLLSVA